MLTTLLYQTDSNPAEPTAAADRGRITVIRDILALWRPRQLSLGVRPPEEGVDAMVTSIRLPQGRRPAFPRRCVLCGGNNPEETIDLKRSVFPRDRFVIHLLTRSELADLPPLAAPACARCRRPFRSRPFWTVFKVVLLLGILVAYLAGFAYLYFRFVDHMQGRGVMPRRAAGIAGIVMIVCSAGSVWAFALAGVTAQRRFFPAPVHVELSAGELLFEFRDEAYGREFEILNHPGGGGPTEAGEARAPART